MTTHDLPRLANTSDEFAPRGVNRRQLLRAGAWAAPVVVLATAVPAASASTTVTGDVIVSNYLQLASDNAGQLSGGGGFQFRGDLYGDAYQPWPTSVTAAFKVEIRRSGTNELVHTVATEAGYVLGNYGFNFGGLATPAGSYYMTVAFSSLVLAGSPNSNGVNFKVTTPSLITTATSVA